MPDIEKLIATEIAKTGYVLEDQIARFLKYKGWTVISGKYYVDDNEDTPREMDLIAYRVTRFDQEVDMYTALIISCKKSEENVWALLARDTVLKDPNTDYWPLHAWSNEPGINYQLSRPGKPKAYHDGVRAAGVAAAVADPQVEVFAFQEMNKVSGAPRNDKAIFAAMTSLVKAQAYELSSLPGRKKTKAVYQFNLISVVGADMYRLLFAANGSGISTTKIDSEQYIARYIVSKKESFSRIRFISPMAFESALDDYGNLHAANVKWFGEQQAAFYDDIIKDLDRIKSLKKPFDAQIKNKVKWRVEAQFKNLKHFDEEPFLSWNSKKNILEVSYWADDGVIRWLNESKDIHGIVGAALKSVYRYSGPFEFDVPF